MDDENLSGLMADHMDQENKPEEEEIDIVLASVTEVTAGGIKILVDGEEEAGEKEYPSNAAQLFTVGDRVKIQKNSGTYIVEYVIGTPMSRHPIPTGGTDGQVLVKDGANNYAVKWGSGLLPTGGSQGQVLAKNSATNYDVKWADAPHELPTGGSANQVLTKNSATNYDVKWAAAPSPTALSNGSYTVTCARNGFLYPSAGQICLGASNAYWNGCYIKGTMRFGDSGYGNTVGFFGKTPVAKQTLYSTSTLANVITALQNYGLG